MDPSESSNDHNFITTNLSIFTQDFQTMKEIGRNKSLAKFGDSVTNFIYSIAKSVVSKNLDQRKVNRTILSHALKNAEMKSYAPLRSDAHAMADTAEAFIGYMYCAEGWTIETISQILIEKLQNFDITDYKQETQGAIEAFTCLLAKIKEHLQNKFSCEK